MRALPICEDNVTDFFKIMRSKEGVMKTRIIFGIRLPLVDLQQHDLFNMTPVPMLTAEEMHKCIYTTNDVFICDGHAKFSKGDRSHECEVNFLLNKSLEACDLESTLHHQTWRQMAQKNQWMFTLANFTEMSFVCGTKMKHLEVKGAATLEIRLDFILNDNTFTIYGHYENNIIMQTSYLRLNPL